MFLGSPKIWYKIMGNLKYFSKISDWIAQKSLFCKNDTSFLKNLQFHFFFQVSMRYFHGFITL